MNHNITFGLIFYEVGFKDLTQQTFGLLLLIFAEMQPKI